MEKKKPTRPNEKVFSADGRIGLTKLELFVFGYIVAGRTEYSAVEAAHELIQVLNLPEGEETDNGQS